MILNGKQSGLQDILADVQLGCVLGPSLFFVNNNDKVIASHTDSCRSAKFITWFIQMRKLQFFKLILRIYVCGLQTGKSFNV